MVTADVFCEARSWLHRATMAAMLRWALDLLVLLLALVTAPVWLIIWARRGKLRTDWRGRLGFGATLPATGQPRLLLHAVSVGEVNALRTLVKHLANSDPAPDIVIAATTDTGFARAHALFGSDHVVVRVPFDFDFAVRRFLNRIRPDVVGLVELEVWPNLTAACRRRDIAIGVINGRLTERSFRRYQRVLWLIRPSFRSLAFAAVQDEDFARRFTAMGVAAEHVEITGTMKWDALTLAAPADDAAALADSFGVDRTELLVVAGSTAPEEHQLLYDAVRAAHPAAQLLCAPRKPEWFDDAAADMPGCVRRTAGHRAAPGTRFFLLDTIGDLRAAYALADVVVIGRSFGSRHGSDMMEPVALGCAVVTGPATSDFAASATALEAGGGLLRATRDTLTDVLRGLLEAPDRRAEIAQRGQTVIAAHQGASARHAEILLRLANARKASP